MIIYFDHTDLVCRRFGVQHPFTLKNVFIIRFWTVKKKKSRYIFNHQFYLLSVTNDKSMTNRMAACMCASSTDRKKFLM